MNNIAGVVEQAIGVLDAGPSELNGVDDAELLTLLDRIEQLGRRVDGLRVLAAAQLDQRSDPAFGPEGLSQKLGFRRGAQLIEKVTRAAPAEVARRLRLGSSVATRPGGLPPLFPRVAAALDEGTLGLDAALVITRCLSEAARVAAPDDLATAELRLVSIAQVEPADIVGIHARVWRERLDPDGGEPRHEELRAQRRFHLGREVNGLTPFGGMADPTGAALLRAALGERSGPAVQPRFLDPSEATDELTDPRTPQQRHYDVLLGLVTAGVRSDSTSPRPVAAVLATIELADLMAGRGSGWLDDVDEPVPATAVDELVCDSGFQRVLFGAEGELLSLGRRERLFSPAQRRALAVRDGGCVFGGCTAPPSWCHAHHVVPWQQGGATDVDNGALLCAAHHHLLHAGTFRMRMIRGRPEIFRPDWSGQESVWASAGRSRVRMTRGVAVT